MARSDIEWAEGGAWDDAARAEFEAQLAKTRAPKRQRALDCKAAALGATRDDEKLRAAVGLHERALAEVKKGNARERWAPSFRLALAHLRRGDDVAAEPLLREVIAAIPIASRAFDDPEDLPETALARLLERSGRRDESDAAWSAMLSFFVQNRPRAWLPPTLERVEAKAPAMGIDGTPYAGLDDAAEHFVVNHHIRRGLTALFDANRAALAALDDDVRFEPLAPPAWIRPGPAGDTTRAVLELGGFLARCAVREAGATILDATPLGKSRIVIAGETRDPFAAAWRVVVRGARAASSFDALVAR